MFVCLFVGKELKLEVEFSPTWRQWWRNG